jgi:hypothetical protein
MNKITKAFMMAALLFGGGSLVMHSDAFAQADSTVGQLRGQIRDKAENGAAVGATVVATSPVLQGEQVVITDETGQYFITALPPGVYTLTVYYNDQTFSRGNVLIQVGKEVVVNVTVDSKAGQGKPKGEVIEIKGTTPIIDQGSTKTGMTITSDYTNNIPTSRTFGGVMGAAAGAQGDASAAGPGISFAGATDLENTYIVEGINTTDTGYGSLSTNLPNEFVQETEVITGGYNAEYGHATGGIVNVVTKQGSNTVHGSVFAYYRPSAFVAGAKTVDAEGGAIGTKNDLDYNYDIGGEVGGPIIKDKLWFHVGFNPAETQHTYTRYVSTLVDKVNNTTGAAQPGGDGIPDVDSSGFNKLQQLPNATHTYILDSKTYFYTAKINGAVNENNQFQISAFGNPENTTGPSSNLIRNPDPAQTMFKEGTGAYDVSAKWTSKLNQGKTEVDAIAGFHRSVDNQNPYTSSAGAVPEVYYNYTRSLYDFADLEQTGGRDLSACQDGGANNPYKKLSQVCPVTAYEESGLGYLERDTKDRTSLVGTITQRVKAAGYHVFKAGVDAEFMTFDINKGYTGGVVWRRSQDTATGAPGRWQQREFLHVERNLTQAEAADPAMVQLKPGELLCAGDRAVCNVANTVTANTTSSDYGAFIQDSWQIRPNVTLNVGLRYEDQIGYAAKQLQGQVTPDGTTVPAQVFNMNDLWAPRFGFIYDPTEEGRAKIFGHWGRFYETVPMDLQAREFGGEYTNFVNFNNNRYLPGSQHYDPNCNLDHNGANISVTQLGMCGDTRPVTATGGPAEYVAPNLRGQYTEELILGGEYEILPDLKLGLNYIHRTLPSVIEDISTDGGNTYLITNPGQNLDADAAALHKKALQEMASNDPTGVTQQLGKDDEQHSQQLAYVKNFAVPVRNYDGVQFSATQRPTKRSLLMASYTYSRSVGNYPGLFSTETGQADPNITSQYDLPDLMANRYGRLGLDRPHNVKVDGFYQWDLKQLGVLTGGISFRAQSGIPQNVLGASPHPGYGTGESYLLPRGSGGRLPTTSETDIHISYGRRLNKNTLLEGFFNVFNLFNQQDQVGVDENYTLDAVNPIVGGTKADLAHAKTLDENGFEQNVSPTLNKNFGHTANGVGGYGNALQAPLNVQIGVRLTF